MKRISIYLSLALITFLAGVTLKSIWVLNRNIPIIEAPQSTSNCNLLFLEYSLDYEKVKNTRKQKQGLIADMLNKFNEIPLENLPPCIDESYRLIMIPISDYPVSIHILRSGDERILFAEKLNANDYSTREATERLTEEEWQSFKSLFDQTSFWDMPTFDKNEHESAERTIYIMEGLKGAEYHYVQRLSSNGKFQESAAFLLKLPELKNEIRNRNTTAH